MDDMVTITAPPGYSIFFFAPKPEQKPSALEFNALLAAHTMPVLALQLSGAKVVPLTIIAPPDGALSYLFTPAGKIFQLDDPTCPCWSDRDQWMHAVLAAWKIMRGVKDVPPPAPSQLEMKPGMMAAIFRH